jgi:hypothetical protein
VTAAQQDRLLTAAHHARAEGWLAHELPEVILAEARKLAVACTPATAQRIAKEASGERGRTPT